MNDVSCMFRFNPVGQGLFYSGQIDDFTFVYDCGGKRAFVEQEIKRLPQKPLDLLIISHMHSDHTRYIQDLIKHCGGVDRVVLPYLHPEEILLTIGEYLSSSDNNGPSDDFVEV
ncbi:MBL fold metallo-hydrolase [Verrucomicrobiota bacterium]